jgi:3-oxoacyl-[acyl-carrier protein] reductase
MPSTPRHALVTGGTQGLGRAVALRLAQDGHQVTCVYRGNEEARAECARAFLEAGLPVHFERANLADAAEVGELFTRLARAEREPDFLVNAAGLSKDAPVAFLGVADFDEVIGVNLRATFLTCQQAVKPMVRRRYGRIINSPRLRRCSATRGRRRTRRRRRA